ncbi:amidase [Bradyrhizobium sp. NFR13]|jgi:amidase|uniref:amidase n=1 Tax=Bradyrhizobium sp. NFR13 TaxID=1566285 RepID=UPI0008E12354|nr:amidase family protein [Bradyrhizobium sp. NFR13]SFM10409.1 amidase [Bradyrhizobium sp. NFR13]
MTDDFTRKSAVELASLIAGRSVSPVEVLDAHLDVIARVNPKLNAIVTLADASARAAAENAEAAVMRGDRLGALHGLPVVIKDITPTAGIRTTYGSPRFKDHVPTEDAEVVRRLKAAGAIILGKTNTPEFAAGANTFNDVFGVTRNPWNLALSPSGSSGGSAVAVATGMASLAQGTDFGCSIRMPASFNGIVGIRPTPGLTPNYPMPLAWDPGQVHGPLARTAEDAALMLDAMIGFSRRSPISVAPPWASARTNVAKAQDVKDLRIAYVSDISGIGVDPEIDAICRACALSLRDAGATVEEISFDIADGKGPYQAWRGLWMVGQQFANLDQLEEFGVNLKGNVKAGLKVTPLEFAASEQKRQELFLRFAKFFESYDLLISPQSPVKQFPVEMNFPTEINGKKLDNYTDWIAGSFLITLMSLPGGAVPAGMTDDGLPVGIQIVGPRFEEPLILSAMKIVQQLHPIGWPP